MSCARRVLASLLLGLTVAGCHAGPRSASRPPQETASPAITEETLHALGMLAIGARADPRRVTEEVDAIAREPARLGRYIDTLLADPRFGTEVAYPLLLGEHARPPIAAVVRTVLSAGPAGAGGRPVLFLRKPCDPKDALPVHPWWALDTEVLVCPDAYRPERFEHPVKHAFCGGRFLSPSADDSEEARFCGCGRNLVLCFGDQQQASRVTDAVTAEVAQTIAYVVRSDHPVDDIYTKNETVRDGWAESMYQRGPVMTGEVPAPPDPRRWTTQPGMPTPRHESYPGQHAGILTAPGLLYTMAGERERMAIFAEKLWGGRIEHFDVNAQVMLSLGAVNLRDRDGWQQLAAMPICTACHARLDYGLQYFHGYPRADDFVGFLPARQLPGQGPLYLRDIRDRRGEGALTPKGFAELAVRQKEFADNIVERVVRWVFGGRATPEDRRAVTEAFARGHSLKAAMRAALSAYATRPAAAPEASTPPAVAAAPRGKAGEVAISTPLRAELDHLCSSCHDDPGPRDLRGQALPRDRVLAMLNQVAFEAMPKTAAGLARPVREHLLRLLIDALWPGDPTRHSAATRFFVDGMRAGSVFAPMAALGRVHADLDDADGARGWALMEPSLTPGLAQVSPGFAAVVALEALATCEKLVAARGRPGSPTGTPTLTPSLTLDACLARPLSVGALVNPIR